MFDHFVNGTHKPTQNFQLKKESSFIIMACTHRSKPHRNIWPRFSRVWITNNGSLYVSTWLASGDSSGVVYHWSCPRLLAAVNVYDLVLVHELEYVGGVHQDADGPDGRHQEEDPQLGSVHHHRHELPVFSDLKH